MNWSNTSPKTACGLRNLFRIEFGKLSRGLLMRRAPAVQGTRELVVPRTPYIIVYRVRSRGVFILRVYRGARRWPARFD